MGKAWPALDIHLPGCDPQLQELVLAELDDFQPTALQEPEGLTGLRAFFPSPDLRDRAAEALGQTFGMHLFTQRVEVDDEDWAARSQAALQPITIGRITVSPDEKRGRVPFSLEPLEKGTRPLFLVIKPSMGFGTGHHETTRLMLQALQTIDLTGRDVLDVGCGSAVLAIAAVCLGARQSLGVDIDPDALTAAAENVQLNRVGASVTLELADVHALQHQKDVVLANLTGSLIERSAASLARLVSHGGHLIVSGIMESEETVIPALAQLLALQDTTQEHEWLCARFTRL